MKKIALIIMSLILIIGGMSSAVMAGDIAMEAGTYSGKAQGMNGEIEVKIKVSEKEIESIEVISEDETDGITDSVFEEIPAEIIANQSFSVDTISGATFASEGLIEAVKNAVKKAKGIAVASNEKTKEIEEASEQSYDVVVVGAGGAGLAAAVEARNGGADVVLLEKMPTIGGNTKISGGGMAAAENWVQKEKGIEDSKARHIKDTLAGGDFKNDPKLVTKLAYKASDAVEWLRDYINVVFEDYLFLFGGHTAKRSLIPEGNTGYEIIKKFRSKADELNIPIKLETKAVELIKDGDRITGVKAEKNGKEIVFNAKKGVILTTGGFGSNVEMRKRFNPEYDEDYLSTNGEGITGDGIVMAENAGAALEGMQYIQSYPICNPITGQLSYIGNTRFISTVLVNKEGKRFVEELERRDVISSSIIAQTGSAAYQIWDQNIMDISKVGENHKAEMNYLLKNDLLVKVDNIKEGADFFNIDDEQLSKTVARYNKFAEQGYDEDFNRRGDLIPIKQPPFYILKAVPAIHHTMGGIKINTNAQVLDKDGNIIPGLFAAGEVTGGIHGTNRLGSNAIADAIVYGRTAGQMISK